METKQKIILYVDDDADDQELLTDAIHQADPDVQVILAENGLAALDYLSEQKRNSKKLPCLIVLDINMPFLDGKETVERIKADDVLGQVPVIVFSSSEKPADKAVFSRLGIRFFTKPNSLVYLADIVNEMVNVCC